MLAWLD